MSEAQILEDVFDSLSPSDYFKNRMAKALESAPKNIKELVISKFPEYKEYKPYMRLNHAIALRQADVKLTVIVETIVAEAKTAA